MAFGAIQVVCVCHGRPTKLHTHVPVVKSTGTETVRLLKNFVGEQHVTLEVLPVTSPDHAKNIKVSAGAG